MHLIVFTMFVYFLSISFAIIATLFFAYYWFKSLRDVLTYELENKYLWFAALILVPPAGTIIYQMYKRRNEPEKIIIESRTIWKAPVKEENNGKWF